MAGYIGSKASVVSSGAERKKVFAITTTTTSLTGLTYTPTKVHVYHNGIRLVDGTDYTATNGTSITLNSAAESGDEVVVVSYATFQVADAYTQAEADAEFVNDPNDVITVSGSNVGIGTDLPSNQLSVGDNLLSTISFDWAGDNASKASVSANHATGEVKFNAATNYFPTFYSNGSERMRIDTAGRVTMPNQPSFKVAANYGSPPYINGATLLYTAVEYDVGNNFANNRFTAPVAGVYHFDVSVLVSTVTPASGFSYIALTKNGGALYPYSHSDNSNITSYHVLNLSRPVQLAANDYVQVYVYNHSSHRVYNSIAYNHFSGHLIG
jgi:hypothetical protein